MVCSKCGKEFEGKSENDKICSECKEKLILEITSSDDTTINVEEEKNTDGFCKKIKNYISEKFKKINAIRICISVCILIIIVSIIFLAIILYKNSINTGIGNTIGNIRNYGYTAKQGEYIYYVSPIETDGKYGIYKMKSGDITKESKTLLYSETIQPISLNVYNDYIYFIGIESTQNNEEDTVDNKIFRMRTDGTHLEIINDNEFDNNCYEIYVLNGKIYYFDSNYNICTMSLNGANKSVLTENGTGYLGVSEKYILYNVLNEDGTDYVTYIMDIDGQNSRQLIENVRLYSTNILGDYVYYTSTSKQICRVKVDGTELNAIYDADAYYMNISGEYIYYLAYNDESNVCLYRLKADGSSEAPEEIKKFTMYSTFICVEDDWVMYTDADYTKGVIDLINANNPSEVINVFEMTYNTVVQQ